MVDFKSAQHSIRVDPELVDDLTRDSPLGPWHRFPEYWLGNLVEDGKISYDEGYKAAYGAYQTLKTIEALPGFRQTRSNKIERFAVKLKGLASQLVTIVDEQKHIIRVHGVDIQIEGNPSVEEMVAIGEGIRRHEPWLIKEIFTDIPGRKKTRIFFGEKKHWAEQIGSPFGFNPEEIKDHTLFMSKGTYSIIFLSKPLHLPLTDSTLNPFTRLSLTHLTDHESGHAVIHYLTTRFRSDTQTKLPREKAVDSKKDDRSHWELKDVSCLAPLHDEYEQELIEVFFPEKVSAPPKKKDVRELVKRAQRIAVRSSKTNFWMLPPKLNERLEQRHLRAYSLVDGDEFLTDGYQLFRHPEKQEAFSHHIPVMATFFSLLETMSPQDFEDPQICERITQVLDQAEEEDVK